MRKQPMRMCAICREKMNKMDLIRIVNNAEEGVCVDFSGRLNGRGAYVCNNEECINNKNAKKILSSALKTEFSDETFTALKHKVIQNLKL